MNKTDFLHAPSVGDFVSWLARTLPSLPVDLKLKRSRFVPASVNRKAVGLDALLSSYIWQSVGMSRGDWSETRRRLMTLANTLTAAVRANDNAATLNACRDTLAWGGNRDWAKCTGKCRNPVPVSPRHEPGARPGLGRYGSPLSPCRIAELHAHEGARVVLVRRATHLRFPGGRCGCHAGGDVARAGRKIPHTASWRPCLPRRRRYRVPCGRHFRMRSPPASCSMAPRTRVPSGRAPRSGWAGSCGQSSSDARTCSRHAPRVPPSAIGCTHSRPRSS